MSRILALALLIFAPACRDALEVVDDKDPPLVVDTDIVADTDAADTDTLVDTDTTVDTDTGPTDADADGFTEDVDCDDANADINPGAAETPYDGLDNDCDPTTLDDDLDADGFALADDCDDTNLEINPDATEICNELDDDCNGTPDDAVGDTWYDDLDGDGFGDPDSASLACTAGASQTADFSDCDDARAEAFPGADEICNELDDDCDGVVDDNPVDGLPFFRDSDGDGIGDALQATLACTTPLGFSGTPGDCDDADASTFPGAEERCNGEDDDCNGRVDDDAVDAPTWYTDADSDGFGNGLIAIQACAAPPGTSAVGTDCDDLNASANPDEIELCNGFDDDCDTLVDEDEASDTVPWYADRDGDGFGDADDVVSACAAPTGRTDNATDCDDDVASIYPGAPELCDGLDNDCTGTTDDDPSLLATWYRDDDGDGFGVDTDTEESCRAPAGYVAARGDCDDTLEAVFPGADETCDGTDEDCNGDIDNDPIDPTTWYLDFDRDGFGGPAFSQQACSAPPGYVERSDDCDDGRAEAFPHAEERCNNLDDDCDTEVDEDPIDPAIFWVDGDGDGSGDPESTVLACTQPPGTAVNGTDCDDTNSAVHPGATEVCNGLDDDCLGGPDGPDSADALTWYRDGDSDGFGDPDRTLAACAEPDGYTSDHTDCDDVRAAISPDATEICNGRDDDCDGDTDSDATDQQTWYDDTDGDGFGAPGTGVLTCSPPTQGVRNNRDCDDAAAGVFPGASEVCNGVDDDCDGDADSDAVDRTTSYADTDGDGRGDPGSTTLACGVPPGFVAGAGDCDDTAADVFRGAAEQCDGRDGDCDGDIDSPPPASAATWYADADEDGFGNSRFTTVACDQPDGFTSTPGDCNDGVETVYPGAAEVCDGLDNDCNSAVDDGATGAVTWYLDSDGDGFGGGATSVTTCTPPSDYVRLGTDCDDTRVAISPAATEVCNGLDDNCDGTTDTDAVDRVRTFADADGDGFGGGAGVLACPTATDLTIGGDCDDADATENPGAEETCNGEDTDCDGTVDGPDPTGAPTFYVDADGDGFGNPDFALDACSAPAGYVDNNDDCDDLRADASPDADETCDGTDDDCDGTVDEDDAIDAPTWYADTDSDGFGTSLSTTRACNLPTGFQADQEDCDDDDSSINPDAEETCDAVDRNCDGDPSDGTAGENAVCPADSCLDVLERGNPTMSDFFWLDAPSGPYEEYCDFGTVSAGWAWRSALSLDNPTGTDLVDSWVPLVLDVGALSGAGKLQGAAEDLRVFTLDGPLLSYWIDLQPGDTTAEVWVRAPSVPASGSLQLVIAYGNPDTERKSIAWWYDAFDAVSTSPYGTYHAWSPTPRWSWDLGRSAVTTDTTNGDYLLQAETVDITYPVYVETRAMASDDDGVGVMLRQSNGGFIGAAVTDDYQGVQNSAGLDGICKIDTLPTAHRQAAWLVNPGNVASSSTVNRVGMYYDGVDVTFYVNGVANGTVQADLDLVAAGLVSFANSGSPGAVYDYLWIGEEPIDFDPEDLDSDASGVLGVEAPF